MKAGDVLVLICRGPLGTGMEEIYQITAALKHLSFGKHVAVLTDARFSGVSTGACVGHVAPEALAGGPIGKVVEGDRVRIVIDRNRLEGSIDLVGHGDREWDPAEGARVLAGRPSRPDLARRSRSPAGDPALGGAPGGGRRHLGRVRVRRRRDHRGARARDPLTHERPAARRPARGRRPRVRRPGDARLPRRAAR